jgi:hypothetical protein
MSGLFYNLGRLAGPKIRKAKWAYLSATAPEASARQHLFKRLFFDTPPLQGSNREHR